MNFTQLVTAIQIRLADASLATDAIVGSLVNEAHSELLESEMWSRKRDEIIISTIAEESSGTFTVTNGSSTATISGGSLSSADEGKYIKFSSDEALYVVSSVSGNDLTLTDFNGTSINYAGDTDTAATYVMFQRWYNLGTNIESIYTAKYDKELNERLQSWLDSNDHDRSETGDPIYYSFGPRDSSDRVQIEFYPRPTGTIAVTLGVILGHTDLSGSDNPIVPSPVILWKAATLGCHYLFGRTNDKRWLALAELYDKNTAKARESVRNQDERKFGLPSHIQDPGGGGLVNSDYSIDHDLHF